MEVKQFKELFRTIAEENGFKTEFGGWFKESNECIVALDLQRSNFSTLYYLNIQIFVQRLFGESYVIGKELLRNPGTVFRRQPNDYNDALDLNLVVSSVGRTQRLEELFRDFLVPFTEKALTVSGLKELAKENQVFLLPRVKEKLLS